MHFPSLRKSRPELSLLWLLAPIFLSTCSLHTPPKTSFYYWKSTLSLDSNQRQILKTCHSPRLYIKAFDVDLVDSFPQPIAIIKGLKAILLPKNVGAVPVVYITVRSLKGLDESKAQVVGTFIAKQVMDIWKEAGFSKPDTIQLDCDWTPTTKWAYFSLIQGVKETLGPNSHITVTLRLHQYASPETTGVPPVGACLMLYNMSDIKSVHTTNGIVDIPITSQYLTRVKRYPLPLTIAMPAYSQVALYRNNTLRGISADPDPQDTAKFGTRLPGRGIRYQINGYGTYKNLNLIAGDVVRFDFTEREDILALSQLVGKRLSSRPKELVWYHLGGSLSSSPGAGEFFQQVSEQF